MIKIKGDPVQTFANHPLSVTILPKKTVTILPRVTKAASEEAGSEAAVGNQHLHAAAGRPKVHASKAEKQRAYRARRAKA